MKKSCKTYLRRTVLILCIVFGGMVTSQAQDAYISAIGLRGGPYAGVSYKHFVWPVSGVIEGIAGFSFLNDRTFALTGLYEHHLFINYNLNVFGGGGMTFGFGNTFRWQLETIVGAELLVDTLPLLISIDFKPGWSVLENDIILNEAAISVRYILRQ